MSDLSYPVLWIDPGKMTGLALWMPNNPVSQFWADEFGFMEAGNVVESVAGNWPSVHVGWEHFHVHAKTPGDDAHHAIEMIGVVRRIACQRELITFKPAPPGSRDIATMAMLKHLGWWIPGKDDAQSAAQHLLAWMLRSGNVPAQVGIRLHEFREQVRDA